jgi:pyruvate/2-oxoglutarate dehydrogenase complex dihydrolipoamide dehydrogenase (E3) component
MAQIQFVFLLLLLLLNDPWHLLGRTAVIVDATPKRQVQFSGPTGLYSKALRDTAKKIDVSVLKNMGVRDTAVWRQVQEMTDDVLKASGLSNLGAVQTSNIPHLRGTASFKSNDLLEVTFLDSDRKIEVKGSNFLIATGSRAYRLNQIKWVKTLNHEP